MSVSACSGVHVAVCICTRSCECAYKIWEGICFCVVCMFHGHAGRQRWVYVDSEQIIVHNKMNEEMKRNRASRKEERRMDVTSAD